MGAFKYPKINSRNGNKEELYWLYFTYQGIIQMLAFSWCTCHVSSEKINMSTSNSKGLCSIFSLCLAKQFAKLMLMYMKQRLALPCLTKQFAKLMLMYTEQHLACHVQPSNLPNWCWCTWNSALHAMSCQAICQTDVDVHGTAPCMPCLAKQFAKLMLMYMEQRLACQDNQCYLPFSFIVFPWNALQNTQPKYKSHLPAVVFHCFTMKSFPRNKHNPKLMAIYFYGNYSQWCYNTLWDKNY